MPTPAPSLARAWFALPRVLHAVERQAARLGRHPLTRAARRASRDPRSCVQAAQKLDLQDPEKAKVLVDKQHNEDLLKDYMNLDAGAHIQQAPPAGIHSRPRGATRHAGLRPDDRMPTRASLPPGWGVALRRSARRRPALPCWFKSSHAPRMALWLRRCFP